MMLVIWGEGERGREREGKGGKGREVEDGRRGKRKEKKKQKRKKKVKEKESPTGNADYHFQVRLWEGFSSGKVSSKANGEKLIASFEGSR